MQSKSYENKINKRFFYRFCLSFIALNIALFIYTKQTNINTIKSNLENTALLLVNNLQEVNSNKYLGNLIKLSNITHLKITKNNHLEVLEINKQTLRNQSINNFHSSTKSTEIIHKEKQSFIFVNVDINQYQVSISQELNKLHLLTYLYQPWLMLINVLFLILYFNLKLVLKKSHQNIMSFYTKLNEESKSLSFISKYLKYSDFNKIYKLNKKFVNDQLKNNLNTSYQEIINEIADGVIVINQESHIQYLNDNAKKYLIGVNEKDSLIEFDQLIRHKQIDLIIEKLKSDESEIKKQIKMYLPQKKIIELLGKKINYNNDKAILLIFKDVSKLITLENLRKEFVENVTHELKTPLTVINGFLETIKNETLDKVQKVKFLDIISKQTIRISSIIDNLIVLTDLEDSQYQKNIQFKKENLNTIISNAIESSLKKAQEKNITIIFKEAKIKYAKVNEILFYQVLVNLIDNAIKYSEENKKIKIKFEKNENHIKLLIIDEGNGIEKKHLPFLFQRFYRIDKSRNRKTGGSGLGLSISKHIMELHTGEISVESEIEKGTTIICTLPLIKGDYNE